MPAKPDTLTRVLVRRAANDQGFHVLVARATGRELVTSSTRVPEAGQRLAGLKVGRVHTYKTAIGAVFALDRACELKLAQGYREYRLVFGEDETLEDPDWLEAGRVMVPALRAELVDTELRRQDPRALERSYLAQCGPRASWRARARAIMAAFEGHLPISRLEEKLRPTVKLEVTESHEFPLGGTRFGGLPDMPEGVAWPTRSHTGAALSFVAQIALSHVPPKVLRGLPEAGTLAFFYDVANKPDWGLDEHEDGARVLYFGPEAALARRSAPPELSEDGLFSSPTALAMTTAGSLPQTVDELDVAIDDRQLYLKLATELCGFDSRLGGWPHLLQSEAGEPWQDSSLLLQLASDHGHDWTWFDVGFLYFWTHPAYLMKRNFEPVRAAIRC